MAERPQQFSQRDEQIRAERERVHELTKDWVPPMTEDIRDLRDPEFVGLKYLHERREERVRKVREATSGLTFAGAEDFDFVKEIRGRDNA